jgi:CDP-paratose 2-epimerase
MMEAIDMCEKISGKKMNVSYSETNRIGDHIWYVSDVGKFISHYPTWHWKHDLEMTLTEIYDGLTTRD